MTTIFAAEAPMWTIGGLSFNAVDDQGATWRAGSSQGWYDDPDLTLNDQLAPHNHGSYWAKSYNQPRTIVLPGSYDGSSVASALAARDALSGLFADGGQKTLTVADNGITRTALVGKGARSKITPVVANHFLFQLTWRANDPRKYGTPSVNTTGMASGSGGLDWITGGGLNWITGGGLNWGSTVSTGQVSATNTGTADTWPTFTIAANGGTIVNPAITDVSGSVMSFAFTMSGTDVLVISMNPLSRYAQLNGTDRMGLATSAQWWDVAPGATDVASFGAQSFSGTPSLTMSLAPAYW
jgi:hypothetical protein